MSAVGVKNSKKRTVDSKSKNCYDRVPAAGQPGVKELFFAVLGSLKTEQERLCEVHIELRFAQAG